MTKMQKKNQGNWTYQPTLINIVFSGLVEESGKQRDGAHVVAGCVAIVTPGRALDLSCRLLGLK